MVIIYLIDIMTGEWDQEGEYVRLQVEVALCQEINCAGEKAMQELACYVTDVCMLTWQQFLLQNLTTKHINFRYQCCPEPERGMMKVWTDGGKDSGMYYWLCSCLRVTQMLHPQTPWVTMNCQVLHEFVCGCVCVCDVPDLNVRKVRIWLFLTVSFLIG